MEAAGPPRSSSTRRSQSLSRRRDARWKSELGPVDVLINAPGVNSSTPFFDIDLAEWHSILDGNLTSVFVACQVFARKSRRPVQPVRRPTKRIEATRAVGSDSESQAAGHH